MFQRLAVVLLAFGLPCAAGCSSSPAGSATNAGGASGLAGSSPGGGVAGGSAGTSPSSGGTEPGSAGTTSAGGSSGGAGGAAVAGQGGAPDGPLGPRFIGRFDQSNAAAPVFAWSGTAIALRFSGTSIGVTLTDGTSNVFEVVLDGQQSVVPSQQGTQKYMLGTGLADGPHDLLLYRRTEAFFGETTFNGFDVDPSAYLPGDPVPAHRIEVIGDSISAGYGDEGTLGCTFGPATENQYLSYEALAARALQADLYTEAWSGIGMFRNGDGTTTATMPDKYPLTLPTRTVSPWDFSKFTPDAVLINLGTNDFAKGDPGADFQTAYTKFVSNLRGHYPNARLYLAVGPMLSGDSYTGAKGYLNGVIGDRSAAGDENLALLEFGTQDGTADGFGCDYHPTLKTHQKMADKMVAALKADLGW